jgi:hypothetical protein
LGAYGGAGIGEGFASATVDAAPGIAEAQNLARTEQMALADKFYTPAGKLNPGFTEADYLSQSQNLTKGQMDAMATARTGAEGAYKDLGFMEKMGKNFETLTSPGGASGIFDKISSSPMSLLKTAGSALAPAAGELMKPKEQEETKADSDLGQRYGFSMNPTGGQPQQPRQVQPGQNPLDNPQTPTTTPFPQPDPYGREQRYFAPSYSKLTPEEAKAKYGYADGGITGSGNLNLDIPLNLSSSGGSSNASTGGSNTYPFQSSGGFTGYNNAPQVEPQAQQPVQQTQQVQQPAQENQDDSSIFSNITMMADGGIAEEDRPTETPALKMFQQMQAQRAAQAPQAPQVDANAQYANYLKQTMGGTAQMPTPPTAPPPTSTNLASSGYAYDPIKQQYAQIQGSAPADSDTDSENPFINIKNRPVVGYTATGEKIYGEPPSNSPFGDRFGVRYASGGISHLGDYSDGGRLLRGPGDGVSDSIPAMIGKRQPARLADGEFVVPARIVSELGNGSTEAGARKLYAMMDRIQKARGKTVGKNKVAKNSRSEKYLPA